MLDRYDSLPAVVLAPGLPTQQKGNNPSAVLSSFSWYSHQQDYWAKQSGSSVRGQNHRLRFAAYRYSVTSGTVDQRIAAAGTVLYLRD